MWNSGLGAGRTSERWHVTRGLTASLEGFGQGLGGGMEDLSEKDDYVNQEEKQWAGLG